VRLLGFLTSIFQNRRRPFRILRFGAQKESVPVPAGFAPRATSRADTGVIRAAPSTAAASWSETRVVVGRRPPPVPAPRGRASPWPSSSTGSTASGVFHQLPHDRRRTLRVAGRDMDLRLGESGKVHPQALRVLVEDVALDPPPPPATDATIRAKSRLSSDPTLPSPAAGACDPADR